MNSDILKVRTKCGDPFEIAAKLCRILSSLFESVIGNKDTNASLRVKVDNLFVANVRCSEDEKGRIVYGLDDEESTDVYEFSSFVSRRVVNALGLSGWAVRFIHQESPTNQDTFKIGAEARTFAAMSVLIDYCHAHILDPEDNMCGSFEKHDNTTCLCVEPKTKEYTATRAIGSLLEFKNRTKYGRVTKHSNVSSLHFVSDDPLHILAEIEHYGSIMP